MSLARLLDELPGGPVVFVGEEVVTGDELGGRADAIASSLAGVPAGSPVAVRLPNGADLIATLFGVWKAGAVYVPVNPRLTSTEIDRILESVRPAACIGDDGCTFLDSPTVHDHDI